MDELRRDQLSGEHAPHRGNHEGYACGFSGPHCWECFEPWPCRAERGVADVLAQTPAYPMPALMPRLDYAHHGFQQGGYLSDTGPCVWRADGYSPYCGIARAEHDEVLTRRRGGTWRWPLVPTREEPERE